jgi:monoamine oxidase
MLISHRTSNQLGIRGILDPYLAGAQARQVMAMKEAERISSTLGIVEMVFPNIRRHFELGVSKCWDEDEWARGAYAWFKPGQVTSLMPHVARPEWRVYFAGEHASSKPGWMQGALESGNQAAQAVNNAL